MLLIWGVDSVQAQSVGAPTNIFTFNTTPNGSSLGHLQTGTYGDIIGVGSNWTAIGQAPFPLVGAPYGVRLQRTGQLGVLNFIGGTASPTQEDLVLGFGEDKESAFRLRFIADQFTATDFVDILVGNSSGNVGIGKDPGSQIRLDVLSGQTFLPTILGENTSNGYGVQGKSPLIGVYGEAINAISAGAIYGVIGRAANGPTCIGTYGGASSGGVDYGIFGSASNAAPDWAGYFTGRAFCTAGVWTPSDKRLKSNIAPEENAIEQIMRLKTYTYDFNNEEFDYMTLPEVRQHGFISQELEEVFPEMVTKVVHPIIDPTDPSLNDSYEFKGVNYEQMVPVLTTAIQEQQKLIQDLTERLAELENNGAAGSSKSFEDLGIQGKAELFQNTPNPFNERTTIRYTLPEGAGSGSIIVFNMTGQQIASYENLRGEDLVIEGNQMEAGMYFYSLIVNGEELDVKRMLLTK